MKLLKLIVCCDANNGIGKNETLPWRVKSEMNHFKNTTIGNGNNVCIMGRKTYDSIPEKYRPLYNRKNIVLTKNADNVQKYTQHTDVTCFHTLTQCISFIKSNRKGYDECWIIGGESIYKNTLLNYRDYIQEIHVSKLKQVYDCDTFFDLKIVETQYNLDQIYDRGDFFVYIYKNKN